MFTLGKEQHGFKKQHSTCTLGLTIQSVLSHALDNNTPMPSWQAWTCLRSLKSLIIIGLPDDVIDLIRVWLRRRMFHVDIDRESSCIFTSSSGTIILEKMSNYADDSYVVKWNSCIKKLIINFNQNQARNQFFNCYSANNYKIGKTKFQSA